MRMRPKMPRMSGMTKTAVIDVAGAAAKVHSVSMQITNLIFKAYGNLSLNLDIAIGKVFCVRLMIITLCKPAHIRR